MATRMLQRRGTTAQWQAENPVLAEGEIGADLDLKLIKIGDGVTPWLDLVANKGDQGDPAAIFLPDNSFTNDDTLQDYPIGVSVFVDVNGSFPAGSGGVVETWRIGTDSIRQTNWLRGYSRRYQRQNEYTDVDIWQPWAENVFNSGYPDDPVELIATPGITGSDIWVDLSWEATPRASYYELELRDIDDNNKVVEYKTTTIPEDRFNNLKPDTPYRVVLRVKNLVGTYAVNPTEVIFTTGVDETIPDIPDNLLVSPGVGSAIATWDAIADEDLDYYEIQYAIDDVFTSPSTQRVTGTIVSWVGLSEGVTYYFRIRSVDTSGNVSDWSTTANATTAQSSGRDFESEPITEVEIEDDAITAPKIAANTIEAGHLVTDSAVITGSAQIAEAVIENAHVINLSAAKVTFGTMSGERITADTMNVDRLTSSTLTATTITLGTGGIFQTDSAGARAVFYSGGLRLYDDEDNLTVDLSAVDGSAYFKGTIDGSDINGSVITGSSLEAGSVELDSSGIKIIVDQDYFTPGGTALATDTISFIGSMYDDLLTRVAPNYIWADSRMRLHVGDWEASSVVGVYYTPGQLSLTKTGFSVAFDDTEVFGFGSTSRVFGLNGFESANGFRVTDDAGELFARANNTHGLMLYAAGATGNHTAIGFRNTTSEGNPTTEIRSTRVGSSDIRLQLFGSSSYNGHDGAAALEVGEDNVYFNKRLGEDWQAASLFSGFVHFGGDLETPGFKRVGDIVLLKGSINGGPGNAFRLPIGYRPARRALLIGFNIGATHPAARIDITTLGYVDFDQQNVSLDGLWFALY